MGGKAGNTFSVATFAAQEEGAPAAGPAGGDSAYWETLMPDAVKVVEGKGERGRGKGGGPSFGPSHTHSLSHSLTYSSFAFSPSPFPRPSQNFKDWEAKQKAGPVMDGPRRRRKVNYKTCASDREDNSDSDFDGEAAIGADVKEGDEPIVQGQAKRGPGRPAKAKVRGREERTRGPGTNV